MVSNMRDVEAVRIAAAHYPDQVNIERFNETTKSDRFSRIQALISEHFSQDSSKMKSLVEIGVPFRTILEVIGREKIDVVVMGNKGRGNIAGTLFGSQAEKVFRHSPVPVFSIRSRDGHKR